MAFRILGQHTPSGGQLEVLAIVPADKQLVVSSIHVCNQANQNGSFWISLAPEGEADSSRHYLYSGELIRANRAFVVTTGITLQENTHIRVKSSNGQISFSLFGDLQDEES